MNSLLLSRCLGLVFLGLGVAATPLAAQADPIHALVVTGANNHDWEFTHGELQRILIESGRFTVEVTNQPGEFLAAPDALAKFQVVVLDYNGPRWGEAAENAFLGAAKSGAIGVVVVHASNNAFRGLVEYESMVGHLWRKGAGHGRFHPFRVDIVDRDHPVTRGMADLVLHPDELYHGLSHMHDAPFRVLGRAFSSPKSGGSGQDEPMIIVKPYGKGRVFHTPLGHVWRKLARTRASVRDPQFRQLLARGAEWAATGEVTLAPYPPNYLNSEQVKAGWKLLFDGTTTTGWRGYRSEEFPAKGWSVEDGALVHAPRGGGGDIITAESFGDFELEFEWAIDKGGNSGVMYRVTEAADQTYFTGPEYQVIDDGVEPKHTKTSAGALYGLAAPPQGKKLLAPGRFNHGRIRVQDGWIEHWLNGERMVRLQLGSEDWNQRVAGSKFSKWPLFAKAKRGHIALQDHGNGVRFRSLRIRSLDGAAPPAKAKPTDTGNGR